MLLKLLTLFFAILPTSLILVRRLGRVMSKHNLKLGKTTIIITEIPGIFTQNELMIRTILYDKHKIIADDDSKMVSFENTEQKEALNVEKESLKTNEFLKLMAISSNLCQYQKTKSLEHILINFFKECGFFHAQIIRAYEIIEIIPTSAEKKISTTVVMKHETKEIFSFSKGHPANILEKCTKVLVGDKKIELTKEHRNRIKKQITSLVNKGQKVIGFATKPLPLKLLEHYSESFAEHEMTFVGMVGITQPLNYSLKESIEKAKEAGLKTYIVTRVKEKKAIAIAKELKAINPSYYETISGPYLEKLSDGKISKMLLNKDKDFIFTDMKDEDKERVSKILNEQNEHLAFVTTDASTFTDTITSIRNGRIVNNNQHKFLGHTIVFKITESILILTAIILNAPLPLTIPLIIILDLTVNTIIQFALRADYTQIVVMNTEYKAKKINLPRTIITGIILGIGLTIVYLWEITRFGWTYGAELPNNPSTLILSILIITQILSAYALKTRGSRNMYLLLTSTISVIILYIFASFRPLNLTTLTVLDWQLLYFLTFTALLFSYLKKIISK